MEAKGNDLGSLETVGKESSQMQFMFRDRSDVSCQMTVEPNNMRVYGHSPTRINGLPRLRVVNDRTEGEGCCDVETCPSKATPHH